MILEISEVSSPVGAVTIAVHGSLLCALTFSDKWQEQLPRLQRRFASAEFRTAANPAGISSRLERYFSGDLEALDGIAVDTGGTAFQRRVWRLLGTIRPGETLSYRDVAHALGQPNAVRAVGAANGANPIWIVIPCHRVIAANGTLHGYGGGLERKRWLLHHEGAAAVTSKSRVPHPDAVVASLF